jgi:hypothetical protein
MFEIMSLVVDAQINTKEKAAALVEQEAAEMAEAYRWSIEAAKAKLLADIGYCTGYYDNATADRVMDLFETEHPIFGKTHPSAEEALRMGMEYGRKSFEESAMPTYDVTITGCNERITADNEDDARDKATDIAADQTTVELVEDDDDEEEEDDA